MNIEAVIILSISATTTITKITPHIMIKAVNKVPNNRLKPICAINIISSIFPPYCANLIFGCVHSLQRLMK